ncbi:SRPBCC family protein [Prosthecobacter sp.]|uniref:SRPBCC family protein n=1 Tax=Prosthecobacter sp. TaxID=1965333 RepID=UPI002ABC75A5|nr:SRPBCC family protein [Prosthecobacter sp.]MDZ4403644.1 SRPBCC family protein [Prosthecobacter sp.]
METIDQVIDINLPVQDVYNQWTRFESFPFFMEGVQSVRQLDPQRLEWEVQMGGKKKTWQAEIYEQEPDQCIAWRSTSGAKTSGRVDFCVLEDDKQTRIFLHLSYEPEGLAEKTAFALGLVKARVKGNLLRFKEYIEDAIFLPEGWRGVIHEHSVRRQEEKMAEAVMQ